MSGYSNVAVGVSALFNATSFSNIGIGHNAGNAIGTGTHNIFMGTSAGGSATVVNGNSNSVGIGSNALYNAPASSVAVGYGALSNVANSSSSNIAIGTSAGGTLASGNFNIFLGSGAGTSVTAASNNLYIGNFSGTGFETSSGNIFISEPGGSGVVRMHIDSLGNMVVGGTTPLYRLDVRHDTANYVTRIFNDGNGTNRSGLLIQAGLDDHTAAGPSTLIGFADGDGTTVGSITFGSSATAYNTTSDRRLKENIVDTSLSLSVLNRIHIRDYTWIADQSHRIAHGVIAQELYDVYPDAVTRPVDENTGTWMVDYSKLTPLLVKAVQDLDIKIEALDPNTNNSFAQKIIAFLGSATNGITKFFAGEVHTDKLCVGNTCLDESQVQQILNTVNTQTWLPSGTSGGTTGGTTSGTTGTETTTGGESTDGGSGETTATTDTGGTDGSGTTGDTITEEGATTGDAIGTTTGTGEETQTDTGADSGGSGEVPAESTT